MDTKKKLIPKIQVDRWVLPLILIFILMMVMLSILSAYAVYRNEVTSVHNLLGTLPKILSGHNLPIIVDQKLEALEVMSMKVLDTNTMTFLFQIFSASLIAVGVYLARRFENTARLIDKKSLSLPLAFEEVNEAEKIITLLTIAYRDVILLKAKVDIQLLYFSTTDELDGVIKNLTDRKKLKRGFSEEHINFFVDWLAKIMKGLNDVRRNFENQNLPINQIQELQKKCEECEQHISPKDANLFIQRYDEQIGSVLYAEMRD